METKVAAARNAFGPEVGGLITGNRMRGRDGLSVSGWYVSIANTFHVNRALNN